MIYNMRYKLHTLSIEKEAKIMKKKGMIRVMIIEFLADSPMDKIESASSADVIDGKYSVVV